MKTDPEIESLMGWWREAGVDTLVADDPESWFDAAPKKAAARPAAGAPAAPPDPAMPESLDAFRAWFLAEDFGGLPQTGRVAPAGDPASGLMVLLDMPEPGDADSGQLVSGEAGTLLDRMLAAIGRDRASIYLASLSPATVPGGALPEAARDRLVRAGLRHVSLAAPKRLLLMGEGTSRALCGVNLADARGELRAVNHDRGSVPAIATFHPRFLLRQPGLKAESWKDLQLLLEGFDA